MRVVIISPCSQKVERIWLPSASLGSAAATWQASFVDALYMTPSEVGRCDYPKRQSDCGSEWASKDLPTLIGDIDEFRAPNVRGIDVLLNMGADFTYEASEV